MGGVDSKLTLKSTICDFLTKNTAVQFKMGPQAASEHLVVIASSVDWSIDAKGAHQSQMDIEPTGNADEIGPFMINLAKIMFETQIQSYFDYIDTDQVLSFCLKRGDKVAGCWFQIQGNLFRLAINVPLDRPSTSTANGPSQSSAPPDTTAASNPDNNNPNNNNSNVPADAAPASAPPVSAMYGPRSSFSAELLRMEALVDRVSAAMHNAF